MKDWYCIENGRVVGPMERKDIDELVALGSIEERSAFSLPRESQADHIFGRFWTPTIVGYAWAGWFLVAFGSVSSVFLSNVSTETKILAAVWGSLATMGVRIGLEAVMVGFRILRLLERLAKIVEIKN